MVLISIPDSNLWPNFLTASAGPSKPLVRRQSIKFSYTVPHFFCLIPATLLKHNYLKMSRKNKVIVILGPTASGKSQLALKRAQKFNGFIISADSRQIYQKMNIATAKPSQADRQLIPHFMIDIVKPGKNFSVAEYQQQVFKILHANLRSMQPKLPFIVGGTGL